MHLCCKRWHRSLLKAIVVVMTPLVILPLPLVAGTKEAWCGYVLLLTATYWITEAMPLGVTALLPAALFPVTGILPSKQIAPFYMTETVMLFLGCFTMAAAIVKCNLHKRFALKIMLTIGCTPPRLLLGFMLAALLLSMWMSNTTATAMMMPIAEAVLAQLRLQEEECAKPELEVLDVNGKGENLQLKAESGQLGSLRTKSPKVASTNNRVFGKALCLAVAYAASCGGTATLIGCGPTILMKAFVDRYYETLGVESAITFANWMLFGFPLGIIMMLFAWIWLQLLWFGPRVTVRAMNIFSKKSTNDDEAQTVEYVLKREYGKLGPIRFSEISTLLIFIIAIGLWITRNPGFMPGWKYLFSEGSVGSMVPAIFGVILLFVWPIRAPWSKQDKVYIYEPLMDLKTLLSGVPWDIVLLYGGGMAVAEGCKVSGLSIWMGNQLSGLEGLQPWLLTLILCFVLSLFTEFTSNAATVAIVLPVLEEMAHVMSINPLVLVIPGAMGCSFAFMLPVATPPNAIVYSYGYLRISEMIKSGAVMNVICIVIFMMAMFAWGDAIFKFDSIALESTFPTATFDNIVATTVQPVI